VPSTYKKKRPEIPPRNDVRWRHKFLERLLECGIVEESAKAAGITSKTAYMARRDDDDFRADWAEAMLIVDERRADAIEAATAERAINGTRYTKYNPKGDIVEEGTTPDTQAAVAMLRAYRPARFKERPEPGEVGEALNSFTALVRALGEADRARAVLAPPAPALPVTTAPAIEVKALPAGAAPPSLTRQVN